MSRIEWKENPTEADFPLIDRCRVPGCGRVCDWQPRFEIASRTAEHKALLASKRPIDYVPAYRIVKICADCIPTEDAVAVREMIRRYYPEVTFEKSPL